MLPLVALVLVACSGPAETDSDNGAPVAVDCARGSWEPAGMLAHVHHETLVSTLPGGSVLVAGGHSYVEAETGTWMPNDQAEVWEPGTNNWHAVGNLTPPPMAVGGPAMLGDGTLLRAGGSDVDAVEGEVSVFHPDSESWTTTSSLLKPKVGFGLVTIADGNALIVGGFSWAEEDIGTPAYPEAEVYDPDTAKFGISSRSTAAW